MKPLMNGPSTLRETARGIRSSWRSFSSTCRASRNWITRIVWATRGARRPAVVPHGRRQDRGVSRLVRLHDGPARLQGTVAGRSGEYGVAVLMRYTLRLLTIQQFQRATALICACEIIRRGDEKKWGKEPFRIGLWVGQKTTPNTNAQAGEAIDQAHGSKGFKAVRGSGSPAQLTNCPWCGQRSILANTSRWRATPKDAAAR